MPITHPKSLHPSKPRRTLQIHPLTVILILLILLILISKR
jgi:hypothetical protein